MSKKPLDWTKTGTVEAMAEWLRSNAAALCVVVICPLRSVIAADPGISPVDCGERMAEEFPGLVLQLRQAREQKKRAARIEHAPVSE